MAYADLNNEGLKWILFVTNEMMAILRKQAISPCCETCAETLKNESMRLKLKFELAGIEMISRTDFTDLTDMFRLAKIDHINTVRNDRY